MTQETESLIASDEDLTKLFAGKPTQYRKIGRASCRERVCLYV